MMEPPRPGVSLLAASVYLAVIAPASAREVRLGEHTFTIPEGFEIEPACGPPLVDRPIVADLDERGRLYVADSAGVSDKVQRQLETRPHRVVRLEDTDGDGRYDRSTVFADRMMFPEGALWFDGSLYVAAPPSIWKLTDTDDDGVCDLREEWFQGKTLTGCANDLHGPYAGLDGRIYWCKGAFARQTYDRPGRPPFVTRAAHIFRCRPDGTEIEPVMTGGMDNPVEVTFTPGGERIFTTTFLQHPGGGRRDGLIHAIYGGVYGKVHDVIDEHRKTGDIMPVMTHLGPAVPCGLTRYRSNVLGEGYRDNLFVTLFNLHKVTRHVLEPTGATFRTRDIDFLVSDNPDFHPTDVLEDADGSLLVLDTGGWYKICCPTSQLAKPDVLGTIYRIRRTDGPAEDDPRGEALDWDAPPISDLAGRLDDLRPAVRDRALARLASHGSDAVPALKTVLEKAPTVEARRNGVWALTRIEDGRAREAVRNALADPDTTVRQAATHSAGLWRDRGALPGLLRVLERGPDALRRSAAEAIGRIGEGSAVPALLAASGRRSDRVLEHSLIYALIELADPGATAHGLESGEPRVQRAALIALDQMEGEALKAGQVTPFLTSSDSALRQAALRVVGHHPRWAGNLAGFLKERLRNPRLDVHDLGEMEGLLARLAGSKAVQSILSEAARDPSVTGRARRAALGAMARAGLKKTPENWTTAVAHLLRDGDGGLLPSAVRTARRLGPSADRGADLTAALLDIARDGSREANLRVEALSAIQGGLEPAEPELFRFLVQSLEPSRPVTLRTHAASVLATARLDGNQLRELIRVLNHVGPLEINTLLGAFASITDESLGLELVQALRGSSGIAGLRRDALQPWLKKVPASVRREGEKLLDGLRGDVAGQKARIDELAATLKDGDVRRGQKVFNGEKAACSSCHAIGYLGGKSGPDLTRIGTVRTERDLLESLVYPSATLVRSYEPMIVITTAGQVLNGYLRKNAPDEVILVTGPDKEERVSREDIAELRPGTTSIMPDGLTDLLTPREFADLLAFLKATKW